jgi:rRNA maturation endonuclease Nob1
MKCPNCQTENPVEARFCLNCGHKFVRRCTNCQSELPSGARF